MNFYESTRTYVQTSALLYLPIEEIVTVRTNLNSFVGRSSQLVTTVFFTSSIPKGPAQHLKSKIHLSQESSYLIQLCHAAHMVSDAVATLPDTKLTMASNPVTTPPDTKSTMTPDPTVIPPDASFTIVSDPVTTPPDTKSTMIPDPAAASLPTAPSITSDIIKTPPVQATFASLPREIRDKIYRLAIPHCCDIKLIFGGEPINSHGYQILSPQASSSTYANEACAMLFQRNSFRVNVRDLQVMLGKEGINYVSKFPGNYMMVIPKGSFEVQPWLRHIIIDITMKNKMNELIERVGLLVECPALRRVEVVLYGGHSMLKRSIEAISGAFKALAEKLGRRLIFCLAVEAMDQDGCPVTGERLIGGLTELQMVARDEDSDPEDDNSEIEGDEE